MALASPTKKGKKAPVLLVDDEERSESPSSDEEGEEYRQRFVGDVDLPEGKAKRVHMVSNVLTVPQTKSHF